MESDDLRRLTEDEWRDLGFFYDIDGHAREWRFVGSMPGLLRLPEILEAYASDPRNARTPSHDHFGPYWYLTVATAHEAVLDDYCIAGSTADLRRLAALIRTRLSSAVPRQVVRVLGSDYSPSATYSLAFFVREDAFDPASADPLLDPDA